MYGGVLFFVFHVCCCRAVLFVCLFSYFLSSITPSQSLQSAPTTPKVKADALIHCKAIQNVKTLAEACHLSAKQCLATRHALRQARIDEQAEIEREQKRLEKEAKTKAAKEEKAKVRQANKAAKKAKAAAAAEQRKAEKEKEKEEGQNRSTRRGKGADELLDGEDPYCLTSRFPECEVPVLDTMDHFVQSMCQGIPAIWRARRPPLKKVLDAHGEMEGKAVHAATTLLHSENRTFLSEFAEQVDQAEQQGGSATKTIRGLSQEAQAYRDAFTLDSQVNALLDPWMSFDLLKF